MILFVLFLAFSSIVSTTPPNLCDDEGDIDSIGFFGDNSWFISSGNYYWNLEDKIQLTTDKAELISNYSSEFKEFEKVDSIGIYYVIPKDGICDEKWHIQFNNFKKNLENDSTVIQANLISFLTIFRISNLLSSQIHKMNLLKIAKEIKFESNEELLKVIRKLSTPSYTNKWEPYLASMTLSNLRQFTIWSTKDWNIQRPSEGLYFMKS